MEDDSKLVRRVTFMEEAERSKRKLEQDIMHMVIKYEKTYEIKVAGIRILRKLPVGKEARAIYGIVLDMALPWSD